MSSFPLSPKVLTAIKEKLRAELPQDAFQMWIAPLVLARSSERSMALGVSSVVEKVMVEERYLPAITNLASALVGHDVSVAVETSFLPRD